MVTPPSPPRGGWPLPALLCGHIHGPVGPCLPAAPPSRPGMVTTVCSLLHTWTGPSGPEDDDPTFLLPRALPCQSTVRHVLACRRGCRPASISACSPSTVRPGGLPCSLVTPRTSAGAQRPHPSPANGDLFTVYQAAQRLPARLLTAVCSLQTPEPERLGLWCPPHTLRTSLGLAPGHRRGWLSPLVPGADQGCRFCASCVLGLLLLPCSFCWSGSPGVSSFLSCFLFLILIVFGGLATRSEWGVLWAAPTAHSALCTQCLVLGAGGVG